jgi:hypothetical protein
MWTMASLVAKQRIRVFFLMCSMILVVPQQLMFVASLSSLNWHDLMAM